MDRILLLADDLTGALDAAAPLRRQGFSASVSLTPAGLTTSTGDWPDVLAMTTETRHDADPASTLRRIARDIPRARLVYKKIDSTLRGQFAREIVALLEIWGFQSALVVPALPSQGRQLVQGRLVIDGVTQDTHLPSLIRQQTGLEVAHLRIDNVRSGPDELAGALEYALSTRASFVVVDAATDGDLDQIARAVQQLEARPLVAGSAGFAGYLPIAWDLRKPAATPAWAPAGEGPLLFVLGSAHPRTHAQVRSLREQGVEHVEFAPELIDTGISERCVRRLQNGVDVVLTLLWPPDLRIDTVAPSQQHQLARGLAGVVRSVLWQTNVATLVLSGGDTAYAVCKTLGVSAIVLDGEILPGLPIGHGLTADGKVVMLITKAGGFGQEDALNDVRSLLRAGMAVPAGPHNSGSIP